MSRTSDFICKEFDTIIKDSREYRAYELGMANGFFELYRYIKTDIGVDKAKEQFKYFIQGKERVYEYFNRLIEIDEEPVTEWEEKIERYKEYKERSN